VDLVPGKPEFVAHIVGYHDFCAAQVAALQAGTERADAAIAERNQALANQRVMLPPIHATVKNVTDGDTEAQHELEACRRAIEAAGQLRAQLA
jgi:hypothetical protein